MLLSGPIPHAFGAGGEENLWDFLSTSVICHFLLISLLPAQAGEEDGGDERSLSFHVFQFPKTI